MVSLWAKYTPNGVYLSTIGGGILYDRIRHLREDADLSQEEMAKELFMHRTTYVRYESGQREIPLNIAVLIAKYHQVSLDYLAGLEQ